MAQVVEILPHERVGPFIQGTISYGINSMAPGRFKCDFKILIFNLVSLIGITLR